MEGNARVRTPLREFQPHDHVLFRNFGAGDRWLEGVITTQMGAVSYEIQAVDGSVVRQHIDQMLKKPVNIPVNIPNVPIVIPEVPALDAAVSGVPEASFTKPVLESVLQVTIPVEDTSVPETCCWRQP